MIEQLTNNFKIGTKIKKEINRLKVVHHSDYVSHVGGFIQATYIYSDEQAKIEHIKKMKAEGWKDLDAQKYTHICHNFFADDKLNESMEIPCQVFQKSIEKSIKIK